MKIDGERDEKRMWHRDTDTKRENERRKKKTDRHRRISTQIHISNDPLILVLSRARLFSGILLSYHHLFLFPSLVLSCLVLSCRVVKA